MTAATELDFTKDTVIFLDDEYYTTIGALKAMGIGQTTLSKEIREDNIEPYIHPKGHLFSKAAVSEWLKRRSKRIRNARKINKVKSRLTEKTT